MCFCLSVSSVFDRSHHDVFSKFYKMCMTDTPIYSQITLTAICFDSKESYHRAIYSTIRYIKC